MEREGLVWRERGLYGGGACVERSLCGGGGACDDHFHCK